MPDLIALDRQKPLSARQYGRLIEKVMTTYLSGEMRWAEARAQMQALSARYQARDA